MAYIPDPGDIIKMHAWHGVVLKVFCNDQGQDTVLQVQTVRNVFRGYPPEFIELNAAPDAVSPATRADLEAEIQYLQQMREIGLQQMLDSIRVEAVKN
ncbi:MAG: hypothetical protein KDJ52_16995 [Anaerolineae bacterium]|nr:hypothetical protein [Anaerolineae bacterium]